MPIEEATESQSQPKYITVDDVLVPNPKYRKPGSADKKTTVANPEKAIAITSTPEDLIAANEARMKESKQPVKPSRATAASIQMVQDEEYLGKFNPPAGSTLDCADVIDGITEIFSRYEVPIGLLNKLLALSEFKLNFIIDDSGSMACASDAVVSEATPFLAKRFSNNYGRLTRWQEAEDRLHVMIDMLAFIPTNGITLQFLNRRETLELSQRNTTPADFAKLAHEKIEAIFRTRPNGTTPVYEKLRSSFKNPVKTMHYLLTDGMPDERVEDIQNLIYKRDTPGKHPLTFISCTDQENDVQWMRDIEEEAEFTSEIDDFASERKEVLHDQGPGFPYSRGFWLLCQLVSAINPNDLDALDESVPLCKNAMDNLMGRILSENEYKRNYFDNNPNAHEYKGLYTKLLNEYLTPKDAKAALNKTGKLSHFLGKLSLSSQAPDEEVKRNRYY